jgi:hypothetical protein
VHGIVATTTVLTAFQTARLTWEVISELWNAAHGLLSLASIFPILM